MLIGIDKRALALFRIVFGLVCIGDVLRRMRELSTFYTNEGLLSNHFNLFIPNYAYNISLLNAFSSPFEVTLFFLFTLFCLGCFTLGYRTKFFHVLCWICILSITTRNYLIEYGGDIILNILMFWSIFLPLGDRFSIDAISFRDNQKTERSLASTALILQLAIIYILNAWNKDGMTWIDGSATYYTLHQDRIVTVLGLWVREVSPTWLLQWTTWGTIGLEWLLPILILSPACQHFMRRLALILIIFLHGGLALVVNLGFFSYIMIAYSMLLIHSKDCDRIENFTKRFFRYEDHDLPQKRERKPFSKFMPFFQTSFLFIVLLASGTQIIRDNKKLEPIIPISQPQWADALVQYLHLFQGWRMFAPDAPRTDSKLVIALTLDDGTVIDPQNGKPPVFSPVKSTDAIWTQHWDTYSLRITEASLAPYRKELGEWLSIRQSGILAPYKGRIKSFEVWLVQDQTPPMERRDMKIQNVRKWLVLSSR